MARFPKLSLLLSVAALVAFSSSGIQMARAELGDTGIPLTHQSAATCEAAPNAARDGVADRRLAGIQAHLEATQLDSDTIPLNGSGYNYRSEDRVSNELLFMDAELQSQAERR